MTLDGNELGYRIGETDRQLGGATPDADGFIVLNLTNGNVFKAQGGIWVDGGVFPADLLAEWYATTAASAGYRIDESDQTLGAATVTPEGFLVLNQANGKVFKSQGGIWVDGGAFPSDLLAAWLAA